MIEVSDGLATAVRPLVQSIDDRLEFLDDDELLEITPGSLRLRKKLLKESDRKRESRQAS